MKRRLIFLFLLIIYSSALFSQVESSSSYLGQKPPGAIPELFAPGIICTGFNERDITISPDGKEIYYGLLTGKHITIMLTKLVNGKWTEPEIAPFASDENYFHLEPCISSDGNHIYFLSTRPPKDKEPKPRWTYQNIWSSNRNSDGTWSEPNLDTLLNKSNTQFYPSVTKDGTMYFTGNDPQTKKPIILKARLKNGQYQPAEKLPEIINQEGTSPYNAFISPDESFLLACIDGRNNEINPGFANYYVFFRDNEDNWSEGISFGAEINMKGSTATSASISPDGKYLFFAAQKVSKENEELSKTKTLSKMKEFMNSPQNGNYDIYWVDAKIIDELKPTKNK